MLRNCKRNLHENDGISLLFFVFYQSIIRSYACYARRSNCLYTIAANIEMIRPPNFCQLTKIISVL